MGELQVWVVTSESLNWEPEAVFGSEEAADVYASMGDMEVYGPFEVDNYA